MIYFKEFGVIEQSEIRRNKPNLKPKIVRVNYGTFVSAASSAPSPTETLFDIIGFTIHNIVFTSTISTKATFAAAMLFRSKRRVTFHIYGRT